jgi:hypothetical protein
MRVSHNTFVGQRIEVDGGEYVNNVFQDCVLIFAAKTPFKMSNNQFHNCRIEFTGNAADTLALIHALYNGGFAPLIEQLFQQIRSPAAEVSTAV